MPKVLIIDDDPGILEMETSILESAGFEVITAEDPISGVTRYKQEGNVDLILLDYEMPAGGGMLAFRQLRSNVNAAIAPVVFVTGHTEKELGVVLKFHKVSYLKKPFSVAILVNKVKEMLGIATAPAQKPPTTQPAPAPVQKAPPAPPLPPAPPKPPVPPAQHPAPQEKPQAKPDDSSLAKSTDDGTFMSVFEIPGISDKDKKNSPPAQTPQPQAPEPAPLPEPAKEQPPSSKAEPPAAVEQPQPLPEPEPTESAAPAPTPSEQTADNQPPAKEKPEQHQDQPAQSKPAADVIGKNEEEASFTTLFEMPGTRKLEKDDPGLKSNPFGPKKESKTEEEKEKEDHFGPAPDNPILYPKNIIKKKLF